jgi:hypothetical protein
VLAQVLLRKNDPKKRSEEKEHDGGQEQTGEGWWTFGAEECAVVLQCFPIRKYWRDAAL